MSIRKVKVGIAGTHSTGKSTFLDQLNTRLSAEGVRIGRVGDLATAARDRGFPILTDHNFESTLWIMAEGMRQEAEIALSSEAILVDRPVFDALGYLYAALEISGRSLLDRQLDELRSIAVAHAGDYDVLVMTNLDPAISLGEGRDKNHEFRIAAGNKIRAIAEEAALQPVILTSTNGDEVLDQVLGSARRHLAK
ncbi:AAA family ATPase [Sinorhizobium meliloti]|uniref:AAA family ATPase n=1 Tax=Rhizobium meliloti TaxID=382 RepID=UPI0020746A7B|nr:AAA family ATPase [Sinorhizobium meliloti]MCM5692556.1 ATP-binding protein [Sinorhizobium meliloti]MDW9912331.1 AAA family ATPase [Sinorhizobium meliloti]MDX0004701.1 AAA family ATPase [Sinorhizobium meliloti]MDX0017108.1 AAA family ATPase [Sinorhizobium meliloti]MDX0166286.1 AAA family ATPase [Sinorhizobium meliloti]